jgi:catechol 2,3-dioxygenase-like lactoylglutathione lyase family enzyme
LRIHHVAVLGPDPAALAAFYAALLELPELARHADAVGTRAVWLDASGTTLMFERGARGQNGVLVFAAEPGSAPRWLDRLGAHSDGRTAYTLYGRDPDGNRFGVSSYPHPIGADEVSPGAC